MKRPRSLSLTLFLLAPTAGLAFGCSTKSSAPASEQEAMPEAPDGAAGVALEEAPADAKSAEAQPATTSVDRDGEAAAAPEAKREIAKDDALAGSRLEIAEPMINGGLNRDIIRRKAEDHEADIRACHARALAGDPDLAGTVAVKFRVDARGVVEDVESDKASDLEDQDLIGCILDQVSGWSFAGEVSSKGDAQLRFKFGVED